MSIFALELSAVSVALRLSAAGHVFTGLVPGVPVGIEIAINALGEAAVLMNDAFLVSISLGRLAGEAHVASDIPCVRYRQE